MKFGPISFCSRSYCDGEFLRRNIRIHSQLALQLPFTIRSVHHTYFLSASKSRANSTHGVSVVLGLIVALQLVHYTQLLLWHNWLRYWFLFPSFSFENLSLILHNFFFQNRIMILVYCGFQFPLSLIK